MVASLAVVAVDLAAPLFGQSLKEKVGENNKVGEEVRKVDQAEAAAVLANDLPSIEKYWAEDFTVNAPNNRIVRGKKDVVALVKGGILDYAAFDRTVEAVLVQGNTVVIMGEEKVKPKGNAPLTGQTVRRRFTNVWIKRDGQWQLTARQATIISKE